MTPEDMAAMCGRFDKAIDLVCALAAGDERWKMSVPPNEDKDTDLILVNTLAEAKALLTEIEHLTAEITALLRGQGRAPAPAQSGPVPVALHKAHPIPDSTTQEADHA